MKNDRDIYYVLFLSEIKTADFMFNYHNRTANLLAQKHEIAVERFINGTMSLKDYEAYELEYHRIVHIFTINLN